MEKSRGSDATAWYEAPKLRLVRLLRVGTGLLASGTENLGTLGLGSWEKGVTGGSVGDGSWLGGLSGDSNDDNESFGTLGELG